MKFSQIFIIENFFKTQKSTKNQSIDVVLKNNNHKTQFFVEIYLNGYDKFLNEYIAVFFWVGKTEKPYVVGKYLAAIIDKNGIKKNIHESKYSYTFYPYVHGRGWINFISLDYLKNVKNKLINNNSLKFYFEVQIVNEVPSITETFENSTYFLWPINNFEKILKQNENFKILKSLLFSLNSNKNTLFSVDLYLNGKKEEDYNHLSIFLRLESNNNFFNKFRYTFYVIDSIGKKQLSHRSNKFVEFQCKQAFGISKFCTHETAKKYINKGTLTFLCQVQVQYDEKLNYFNFSNAQIMSPITAGINSSGNVVVSQNHFVLKILPLICVIFGIVIAIFHVLKIFVL